MPNHVTNRLEIHCEDEMTIDKIKMMIFDEDENKKRRFTMQKMLPLPSIFSGHAGYSKYGYDWCRSIWGTKWDVYNANVNESGDTIILCYDTAWSPNDHWVEFLCMYIQNSLWVLDAGKTPSIFVKHQYYDYMGDFGGITDWVPFKNPVTSNYSFLEYAKIYDKALYKWGIEIERFCQERNINNNDCQNQAETLI
ncbi:MAG TPA: hypothetical protein VK213_07525 [Bacteroidales bacterium]|nr:hypothetical protein [Bacteroidales bacterium]